MFAIFPHFLTMTQSNYIIGDTSEDLNREHKVSLKEGQISTILYVLEGYIQGSDDYHFDDNFKSDVDNIFERLETVVNNHYDEVEYNKSYNDPLEITPFQEELEVKKYIRDNPITPEKVTQTQLKSIKGNLL